MPRIAKTISHVGVVPGDRREFIPSVCLQDPEPDRVVVVIENPSEAGRRDSLTVLSSTEPERMREWRRNLVRRYVVEVRNYVAQHGAPITNGVELWEHGEAAIVDEVAGEIATAYSLSDDGKKNYASLCDSGPAVTSRSGGTAETAKQEGSPGCATATIPSATLTFESQQATDLG